MVGRYLFRRGRFDKGSVTVEGWLLGLLGGDGVFRNISSSDGVLHLDISQIQLIIPSRLRLTVYFNWNKKEENATANVTKKMQLQMRSKNTSVLEKQEKNATVNTKARKADCSICLRDVRSGSSGVRSCTFSWSKLKERNEWTSEPGKGFQIRKLIGWEH